MGHLHQTQPSNQGFSPQLSHPSVSGQISTQGFVAQGQGGQSSVPPPRSPAGQSFPPNSPQNHNFSQGNSGDSAPGRNPNQNFAPPTGGFVPPGQHGFSQTGSGPGGPAPSGQRPLSTNRQEFHNGVAELILRCAITPFMAVLARRGINITREELEQELDLPAIQPGVARGAATPVWTNSAMGQSAAQRSSSNKKPRCRAPQPGVTCARMYSNDTPDGKFCALPVAPGEQFCSEHAKEARTKATRANMVGHAGMFPGAMSQLNQTPAQVAGSPGQYNGPVNMSGQTGWGTAFAGSVPGPTQPPPGTADPHSFQSAMARGVPVPTPTPPTVSLLSWDKSRNLGKITGTNIILRANPANPEYGEAVGSGDDDGTLAVYALSAAEQAFLAKMAITVANDQSTHPRPAGSVDMLTAAATPRQNANHNPHHGANQTGQHGGNPGPGSNMAPPVNNGWGQM